MDGADVRLIERHRVAERIPQAMGDLAGSLVGEGDHDELIQLHTRDAHQRRDTRNEAGGLTAARAGRHSHRVARIGLNPWRQHDFMHRARRPGQRTIVLVRPSLRLRVNRHSTSGIDRSRDAASE